MKTFEIKSVSKKLLVSIFIPLALFVGSIALIKLPWIIKQDQGVIAVVCLLASIGIIFFSLRKILEKKYCVTVSDKDLSIAHKGNQLCTIPINQITLLRRQVMGNEVQLNIYTAASKSRPFFFFNTSIPQAQSTQDLVDGITSMGNFGEAIVSSKAEGATIEYINREVALSNVETISQIRTKEKKVKRNTIVMVGIAFVLMMAGTIIPLFINPDERYLDRDGQLYYGEKLMEGVDPKSVENVGYAAIKDPSHVYYQGEVLEWADAKTFDCVRHPIYIDKNGLYQEETNFFSKNKIVPLKGDYDKETFTTLNSSSLYFKDKNSLYELEMSLTDNTLEKLDIEGADVLSFQSIDKGSYNWYWDKNHVYFSSWNNIRACPEIDRSSFVVLSHTMSKDKNNVYYLTRGLDSDDKKGTDRDNYAILTGADAPSFRMINHRAYEDKNQTWTISRGSDKGKEKEEVNVNVRKDVK